MSATHMNVQVDHNDKHHNQNPAPHNVFGFWLYLMTDCLLFASIFATYTVLFMNTANGASGRNIFELNFVLIETVTLLISSITYGFALVCARSKNRTGSLIWLVITFVLGLIFINMELYEFHHLIEEGNGPQRSAFLSAFFVLVGTHGLHVTAGLIWMFIMIVELIKLDFGSRTFTRLNCLSLFWHFLDVIWICVFTVVYLMGKV